MRDLIERLEKASGPDRELDALLWLLEKGYRLRGGFNPSTVFWTKERDGVAFAGNTPMRHVPRYTASLDAAVSLVERVLPGWTWYLGSGENGSGRFGAVAGIYPAKTPAETVKGDSPTPAVALCLALLRAKGAEE